MCDSYEYDHDIKSQEEDRSDRQKKRNEACKKCHGKNGKPVVLIRSDDTPFCRTCFLVSCTHKFRSAFGKTQLIRDGEQVLVAYSGGQSSTAMLYLIQEGLSQSVHRKLRFKPILVHIDEESIYGVSDEGAQQRREKIEDTLKKSGFEYRILSFEELLKNEPDSAQLLDGKSGTKSLTSREHLLKTMKTRGLVHLAKELGCSRLLLGVSCSRLGVELLSAVAQGCGHLGATMTAFSDDRYDDVSIVRPMREFSIKEVAYLVRFCDLEPAEGPNWETGTTSGVSIDRLTEGFLSGLQAGFPSTTFTVFRTSEKLKSQAAETSMGKCKVCLSPLGACDDGTTASAKNSLSESHRLLGHGVNASSDICYTCNITRRETVTHDAYDKCFRLQNHDS